jgi:hypothetical protein
MMGFCGNTLVNTDGFKTHATHFKGEVYDGPDEFCRSNQKDDAERKPNE